MSLLIFFIEIFFIIIFIMSNRPAISIKNDAFFMVFLAQVIVYTTLFPSIIASGFQEGAKFDYFQNIFMSFLFFTVPLCIFYGILRNLKFRFFTVRNLPEETVTSYFYSNNSINGLCFFWLIMESIYIYLLLANDLVYRRIGTEVIAKKLANISHIDLFLLRSVELIAIPILALLLALLIKSRRNILLARNQKKIILLTLLISLAISAVTSFLNSRFMFAELFIIMFLVYVTFANVNAKKLYKNGAVLLVFIFYLIFIIANVRVYDKVKDSWFDVLNPAYSFTKSSQVDAKLQWLSRIDCMDLITKMQPTLENSGYAYGGAWQTPFLISVGQFISPSLVHRAKSQAATTAKVYLMEHYTQIGSKDYQSCSLTDVYGNFGYVGFIFAAIFFAFTFAILRYILLNTNSLKVIFLGLILAVHLLIFEQEFISYLIGWIRYVPIACILLLLIPKKVKSIPVSKDVRDA